MNSIATNASCLFVKMQCYESVKEQRSFFKPYPAASESINIQGAVVISHDCYSKSVGLPLRNNTEIFSFVHFTVEQSASDTESIIDNVGIGEFFLLPKEVNCLK